MTKATTRIETLTSQRPRYAWAFLLSLITAAVFIVPFIIRGHGILYVIDDFNLQQIPFNMVSNAAIKSGNIFWDWTNDLGSQFIGSYSYYTLGSPFFWISCIFPAKWFPYVIGPLLILKFAISGLTSYAFIKYFVKRDGAALVGSLLYAFSSFSLSSITFNSFLDVVAVFPLFLLAFECYMQEGRRGFFAVMTALCAFMNFFFFAGEVVFLLLYFLVRVFSKAYDFKWKKLLGVVFEGIIGVGISAALLLPTVLFVAQNPRTSTHFEGLSTLFFKFQEYLTILTGFLMPAQVEHMWTMVEPIDVRSIHAFLPLFGIITVIAYIVWKKRDWLVWMIGISLLFVAIPILNSAFYLGNTMWYGRWYYMLVLILALASAKALEQNESSNFRLSRRITAGVYIAFIVLLILYKQMTGQSVIMHPKGLIFQIVLLTVGYIFACIMLHARNHPQFFKRTTALIMIFSIISGAYVLYGNERLYPDAKVFTRQYTDVADSVKLPQNGFYRIDTLAAYRNTNMLLNVPTLQSFSTMVNGSIFSFYQALGQTRIMQSLPDDSLYALLPLLSVRYVVQLFPAGSQVLPNLQLYENNADYTVFESKDYIPMGFTFDSAISQSTFSQVTPQDRAQLLLKGLVLTDGQMKKFKDVLPEISDNKIKDTSIQAYAQDVQARKREASQSFAKDNRGFTSSISLKKDNLVFFGVPYDRGWTATVNGKIVQIENVDNGLMAVPAKQGNNVIRFTYLPQGLKSGIVISVVSIILLLLYLLIGHFRRRDSI